MSNATVKLLSGQQWTGQLLGMNVWNCMNVKQGMTKKERARSAESSG